MELVEAQAKRVGSNVNNNWKDIFRFRAIGKTSACIVLTENEITSKFVQQEKH